jgi:hypothetical protein
MAIRGFRETNAYLCPGMRFIFITYKTNVDYHKHEPQLVLAKNVVPERRSCITALFERKKPKLWNADLQSIPEPFCITFTHVWWH